MHIDAKQKSVLEPLIIDVNDIAKHLLQRIPTGLEVSEKALDVLYKALHQELGITFKNELLPRPQYDDEHES